MKDLDKTKANKTEKKATSLNGAIIKESSLYLRNLSQRCEFTSFNAAVIFNNASFNYIVRVYSARILSSLRKPCLDKKLSTVSIGFR
jgi:hypothetical protein